MDALTSYGYTFVTMDLGGYKSGNLNKMLNDRGSNVKSPKEIAQT